MLKKLLLALGALLVPSLALAQAQSGIRVHSLPEPQQVTTSAGSVGLSFQPTFSLVDADGQVLLDPEIESASIELEGNSFPATVQELETPWTIVVLIDASSTLGGIGTGGTFKAVKNILIDTLGGLPDDTKFSMLSFDNTATTRLEFTQDADALAQAINRLSARSSGDSCLHEALYQSVNKLAAAGASGRRAVLAFTASRDDCANRLVDEVTDLARQNSVQIYGLGLVGHSITEEALEQFSGPTGGLSEFKDESTLVFGVDNITRVLNSQWTARATVYPSAGEQQAVLSVSLADQTLLQSEPISFTSPQDFLPPTEIHIKGRVLSTAEGIQFNLDLIQPQNIRQLNVSIVSNDTGQSVMAQALATFSEVNSLPAVGLVPGLEYTLIVDAVDDRGQPLSETSAEFEYEPPQARLIVEAVDTPTADLEAFLVSVSMENVVGAVKHKAWLVEEESEAVVEGTQITVPLGEPILLPADGIGSGEYLVVVQALDSSDSVLAESEPGKINYARPNLIESISAGVSGSPLAIAGLTGFFCIAILGVIALAVFVLPRRAARTGTVELVMPQKERRQAPEVRRPSPPPAVEQEKEMPEPEPELEPVRPRRPRRPAPAAAPEVEKEEQKPPEPVVKAPETIRDEGPAANVSILFPPMDYSMDIDKPVFTVGRREENDAVLPLDGSSGVSGNHLTITYKEGQYFAQDDKSTYGTSIDGAAMEKGKPYPLKDGAVLSLGPKVKIEFQLITKTRKTS